MGKPLVIVTGANGQLGKELHRFASADADRRYLFFSREDLPIDQFALVDKLLQAEKPAFIVNCAAYTAVDKAESEQAAAFLINGEAPGHIAATCHALGTKFIHISTDYVFDGKGNRPYLEEDATAPLNVYGASKLDGEHRVLKNDPNAVVIRTSWVYSEFGKNFVRTMLNLMKDRPSINVVADQWGSPTYAADLARDIIKMMASGRWVPGLYHYSNDGMINWHQFAKAIQESIASECVVNPIPASQYPTPAQRPAYSVMSKEKFAHTWDIPIRPWQESLQECLQRLGAI